MPDPTTMASYVASAFPCELKNILDGIGLRSILLSGGQGREFKLRFLRVGGINVVVGCDPTDI